MCTSLMSNCVGVKENMGLFDFLGRKYGYSRRALRQIIYEADQGNARAEEALQHLFARGMSSDEHNKIRREIL